jgi:hypothetical protein
MRHFTFGKPQKMSWTRLVLALAFGWVSALPAQAGSASMDRALILLVPGADVNLAAEAIRKAGGCVTHIFPSAALIGQVPAGMQTPAGVSAIYCHTVDEADLSALNGAAHRAAQVWNDLLSPPPLDAAHSMEAPPADLTNDALIPPPPEEQPAPSIDPIPGYAETSEYFIGRVAVGIVLPESDGSLDASTEDWTSAEWRLVLGKISTALDWWAGREPNAHLTFVYDDGTAAPVATGYEPITHPYYFQAFWIADVMVKMGYSGLSYFDQVRSYNNALRVRYGGVAVGNG